MVGENLNTIIITSSRATTLQQPYFHASSIPCVPFSKEFTPRCECYTFLDFQSNPWKRPRWDQVSKEPPGVLQQSPPRQSWRRATSCAFVYVSSGLSSPISQHIWLSPFALPHQPSTINSVHFSSRFRVRCFCLHFRKRHRELQHIQETPTDQFGGEILLLF